MIEIVPVPSFHSRPPDFDLAPYVPSGLLDQPIDQTFIPRIAKDASIVSAIERSLALVPTTQSLWNADSRNLSFLSDESIHLILTSPQRGNQTFDQDLPDRC